jgi:hypothetical protein
MMPQHFFVRGTLHLFTYMLGFRHNHSGQEVRPIPLRQLSVQPNTACVKNTHLFSYENPTRLKELRPDIGIGALDLAA